MMAGSKLSILGTTNEVTTSWKLPPRTPGSLGWNDAADPNSKALAGDTPSPAGTSPASYLNGLMLAQATGDQKNLVAVKKYKGYSLKEKPELFFNPKESQTFAKVWQESIELQVKIAPFDEIKAEDEAYYDPLQNAIFISPNEFNKPKSKTRLSTAHELYHAVQNKAVLKDATTPDERKRLIEKKMLAVEEDQFVNDASQKEKMAEAFAWKCDAEVIDYFTRTQKKGTGFPEKFQQEIVKQRIDEFWSQKSKSYIEQARKRYREAKLRQSTQR